jgi:hypothetical protein
MKGERENAFDHPFPKGSMYGPCAFDSRSEKYTLHSPITVLRRY